MVYAYPNSHVCLWIRMHMQACIWCTMFVQKGIWDGIGGAVKNSLRNDILNCKQTHGKGQIPLSSSKKLSTPFDCFEHFEAKKKRQCSEQGSMSHVETQFVPLWTDTQEIARPKLEETYDRFTGLREARQILAGPHDGVLADIVMCYDKLESICERVVQ